MFFRTTDLDVIVCGMWGRTLTADDVRDKVIEIGVNSHGLLLD